MDPLLLLLFVIGALIVPLLALGFTSLMEMRDIHGSFFNHHKWFYHDDFHRECTKCGERQFIDYGAGFPTWNNVEHYAIDWHFKSIYQFIQDQDSK